MRLLTFICLVLAFTHQSYSNFEASIDYSGGNVANIKKYTISIPQVFIEHTMGFSPGLGSSITLKKVDKDHIQLYSICDRGPNHTINALPNQNATIIFPAPTFSPFIGVIDLIKESSAILTEIIPLKMGHETTTGLPIPTAAQPENASLPADLNFKLLPADPKGIDPESLDIDAEGNFWFGDEYGARIFKADISGNIIEILTPGERLPEILKNAIPNRGFEALAITPNNKIYAVMESILDINGKTRNSANFIRMVEIDPLTHKTRTFAYPFDQDTYRSNIDVKIGDLAAIDNTHFLLIEQGLTNSGMRNIVYIIDISDALDISNMNIPNENFIFGNFIKKTELFDARKYGWNHEKLEGIAIIDENTIAITHDNDFGLSLSINDIDTHNVEGYTVDYNTQKLLRDGKETEDKLKVVAEQDAHTWIWTVSFKDTFLNILENNQDPLFDQYYANSHKENLSNSSLDIQPKNIDQVSPRREHSLQNFLINY